MGLSERIVGLSFILGNLFNYSHNVRHNFLRPTVAYIFKFSSKMTLSGRNKHNETILFTAN